MLNLTRGYELLSRSAKFGVLVIQGSRSAKLGVVVFRACMPNVEGDDICSCTLPCKLTDILTLIIGEMVFQRSHAFLEGIQIGCQIHPIIYIPCMHCHIWRGYETAKFGVMQYSEESMLN